jgi:FHA domain-containing protein
VFTISVVLSGSGSTTQGTLASREIFVGRSKKCHLVLKDETVSGVHCRLVAIEGGAIVLDEGSTNGTFINDELVVRPTVMTVNDELRIGPYVLRVQSLVGGMHAVLPRGRFERSQRIEHVLSAKAREPAQRPRTHELPTDLRISQAQVFWRLLGFQEPGTLDQARAAYERCISECQPDTVSQLSPELRALAERRLREVQFAWEYIQRLFSRSRHAA